MTNRVSKPPLAPVVQGLIDRIESAEHAMAEGDLAESPARVRRALVEGMQLSATEEIPTTAMNAIVRAGRKANKTMEKALRDKVRAR